jgi:four helix bundle protein
MAQRHEDLVAWQRADNLCVDIYKLTARRFPTTERFGLVSQLRRASYSVAANIVEGFAFESPATKLRFLRIAAGSLAEVDYGMHLATRLGYLSDQEFATIKETIRRVGAPLHGLIRGTAVEARSHRAR